MKPQYCCVTGMLALFILGSALDAAAAPVPVALKAVAGKWQLLRADQPYFIKGAGGNASKALLAQCGGNSIRTWGVGADTLDQLDEAQKLGLTVTVGLWLGHADHGFNWDDTAAVQRQLQDVRRAVLQYKDHPALLIWALGNEMEINNHSANLWPAMEELAKMVHTVDPNHPTMTVVAEIGDTKVAQIHQQCPDIDIIGINSYGGGPSLPQRYPKAGGTKPYIITEYGPPGTWEMPMNAFGAAQELTSTKKADFYRDTYTKAVAGAPGLCLGSYAFVWGWKIEATATWYGLFLPDQSRLAAVDTLQELWSGHQPEHPCPTMTRLALTGADQAAAGETLKATVEASDADPAPVKIDWTLLREQASYGEAGLGADPTPGYPEAIIQNGQRAVEVKLPKYGGIYRLYCTVHNAHGGAAIGSLPIKVAGPQAPVEAPVARVPFVILGAKGQPYIPSGYMGNTTAIHMDEACTDNPHTGKTCLKVDYTQNDNWGGVAWQSPANDWGNAPGGFNVSAATQLTFWARGAKGGEKVKFGVGMIGLEKKYHDSCKADMEVTLTNTWKQYSLDLKDRDLTCIKSGFFWSLGGQGAPVTFYLSEIRYE